MMLKAGKPALARSMSVQLAAARGEQIYLVHTPEGFLSTMHLGDRFIPFTERSPAELLRDMCRGELFEYAADEVAAACA